MKRRFETEPHAAGYDQAKATALDTIRNTDTFILYTPNTEQGTVRTHIAGRAEELNEFMCAALLAMFLDACDLYQASPTSMLDWVERKLEKQG